MVTPVTPVTAVLDDDGASVLVSAGGVLVGRYVLNDPFKPYLHPLRTPHGHTVSLAMPHDHLHHKGLMYGFTTDLANFWEETPNAQVAEVGAQRTVHVDVRTTPEAAVITQHLEWRRVSDNLLVFTETRRIRCEHPQDAALRWSWDTDLVAAVPVTLLTSQWSPRSARGQLVNYQGLGMRFARSWNGVSAASTIVIDGVPCTSEEALGSTATHVQLTDALDGEATPTLATVGFTQAGSRHAYFVMQQPFSYLAVGPSNAAPVTLRPGDCVADRYIVTVADGA